VRRGGLALGAGYFALFATVGVFQPYWPMHLSTLGFSAATIGVLLGLFNAVRVASPLATAVLADRMMDRRPLMVALGVGMLAAATGLVGVASIGWVALTLALYSIGFNGLLPVYDAHALDWLGQGRHHYGRLRVWGSLGFVVASAATGLWVQHVGPTAIPWALLVGVLATAVVLVAMPVAQPQAHPKVTLSVSVRQWLAEPGLMRFLGICFLQMAGFGAYYGFYTLYLQSHGYQAAVIGAYWAFAVVAEMAMFLTGPWVLGRVSLQRLLQIAVLGSVVRWAVVALFPERAIVMWCAQILHLAGFALFHSVSVLLAPTLLPSGFGARAQALVSSVGWGAGGIVGSLVAGALWTWVGPGAVFVGAWVFAVLAFILAIKPLSRSISG
jgi:PPP family 3-phenylpropionic acid transporter